MVNYCNHATKTGSCTCGGLISTATSAKRSIGPLCSIPDDTTLEQPTGETRIVDPSTGGAKGQKDVQMSMIPPKFLEDLGRLYAFGAKKYDRNNWKRGYKWSLTIDAIYRHLLLLIQGQWLDVESGLPHAVHISWHMATLHTFYNDRLGTDDVGIDQRGQVGKLYGCLCDDVKIVGTETPSGGVSSYTVYKFGESKNISDVLGRNGGLNSSSINEAFRKGS